MALVGWGRSHKALAGYLHGQGVLLSIRDRKSAAELTDLPEGPQVSLRLGPGYLERLAGEEIIFLTPGMRKDLPAIVAARRAGRLITGEVPFFLENCPARIIGVSGSAGKTTTTTLIGRLLGTLDRTVWIGGNIGKPLSPELGGMTPSDLVVLELSSFQLELARRSPEVAVLTNFQPNHLDVHGDLAHYRAAKEKLFCFQGPADLAILSADRPGEAELAAGSPADRLYFGRRLRERGAFYRDDQLFWRDGQTERRILRREELPLPGEHNVENVLAALAVAMTAGVDPEAAAEVLRGFTGVSHRLQTVLERGGITFINDSIATSPDRTEAALLALGGKIVLIAGGYDKGLSYDGLGPLLREKVRVLVLTGPTAPKLAAAAVGGPEIIQADDFATAVGEAVRRVRPGETVLLSPASASYDQFRDFEERGRRFTELVGELAAAEINP